jgi:hypothetical protein
MVTPVEEATRGASTVAVRTPNAGTYEDSRTGHGMSLPHGRIRAVKRGWAFDVVDIRHGSAGALQILIHLLQE